MTDQNPNNPNPNGQRGDQQGPPPVKMNRNIFGWLMIIALAVMVVFLIHNAKNQAKELESWGELVALIESNKIAAIDTDGDKATEGKGIIVKDDRIIAYLNEGAKSEFKTNRVSFRISPGTKAVYVEALMKDYRHLYRESPSSGMVGVLIYLLPWIVIIAFVWFFFFRAMRGGGGGMGMLGNFGRSRHKLVNKEMTSITLDDVAGVEEAKEEVQEIIEFLKHPKKFQRLGGRIPRGVLLIGQPGCGKTLLAKAVAGEAEVPFFSISGSDFVEMFVGVGASRVRDLFKQAKDNSPCIIFLDEIDAVGRRRGSGFSSGGHDEREQTLNAILVEMDGFETNDQVIVIAATNRSDVLDPALTRPGRFDRQIDVHLPDVKGRMQILLVHAKKVKMSPSVDLERLARQTPMFSGADLAAIINEAAIIATMADKDFIEMADLEEARDKVKFGRAFKSRRIEDDERVATAYHEAGHAFLQQHLEHADPLHKVTIMPRGGFLGASFQLPEKDRHGYNRRYVEAQMRVICGGRIAELKQTGDSASGAAMDIRQVTGFARHMVLEWGMSEKLGFIDYQTPEYSETMVPDRPYSEHTAKMVDEEVRRLIDEAYGDAERLLTENWEHVSAIAEALLKYETLSAEDVEKIIAGQPLDKPTVSELLDAEVAKAAKEDEKKDRPHANPDLDPEGGTPPLPSPA